MSKKESKYGGDASMVHVIGVFSILFFMGITLWFIHGFYNTDKLFVIIFLYCLFCVFWLTCIYHHYFSWNLTEEYIITKHYGKKAYKRYLKMKKKEGNFEYPFNKIKIDDLVLEFGGDK